MDIRKAGLGAILLLGGTALLFGAQFLGALPLLGIAAVIILAVGALLLGTSQTGRPV
ncbi:MAG: hypothetical protein V5A18_01690 [Haloarculaceae archaeon]